MPRWYLQGEPSDPSPTCSATLKPSVSVEGRPEQDTPMGLQNPEGLAQAVADVLPASWQG